MWKKGFSTVACMELGYEEIIKACKNYGIESVEIRLGDDGSVLGMSSSDELEKLKNAFSDADLKITDLGSSVCFTGYSKEALDKGRMAVCKAEKLGVKAIRVFLGYFAAQVNPDKPEPDYEGIVTALKELCSYAKDKNTEIWVETHNEFATGRVLKDLIADVNCDNMKIIWDVIHPIEDGEEITATWDFIGKSIAHIHIKDGFDRKDALWHDYKYTKLGEGTLPLYDILDLIKEKGYDGYVSLEWERAWREEIQELPSDLGYVFEMYNGFIKKYEESRLK